MFAKDYTFEARYLGTRGVHLNVQERFHKFSPVTATQNLPTYLSQPSQAQLDSLSRSVAAVAGSQDVVIAMLERTIETTPAFSAPRRVSA